jgi:hypothetical protein
VLLSDVYFACAVRLYYIVLENFTVHSMASQCHAHRASVKLVHLDLFGQFRTRCILKKVLTEESVNKVDARQEEKMTKFFG